jgi:6-phosphogluconolactonase/glucosamine-6-phosphate isomerase/deaminase
MTLTYSIINRSRSVLWVVTGSEKAKALSRLLSGDHSIPAGRIRPEQALVLAHQGAAEQLITEQKKGA